jgi:hypothetical protein
MPKRTIKAGHPQSMDVDDTEGFEGSLDATESVGVAPDDLESQENFDEFFGDGTQRVALHLHRLEPRHWASKRIDGFITELNRGDGWQTIVDNWGGGRYLLKQYINGKYGRQRQIRIAGDPKTINPPFPSGAAADDNDRGGAERLPSSAPTIDVNGVAVPVNDIEMIKRVALFARAMDSIFPKAPDINDTLLQLALDRNGQKGSILDQADQFATLAEKLKQLTGGGGGSGTTWLDLGSQALMALEKMVGVAAAKRGGMIPIPPVVDQTRKLPNQIQQKNQVLPASTTDQALTPHSQKSGETLLSDDITRKSDEVGYQDIAEKAASYIAQGYIVEPQQTPGETNQVLNAVLPPFSPEARQKISSYRKVLNMVSRNVLSSQLETNAESLAQFDLYFNKVFDIFVSVTSETLQPSNGKADDGKSEPTEGNAGGGAGVNQ